MLKENTLFGEIDKVQIAIDRLKTFEENAIQNNENGYYVCDSGGKDSMVITYLCYLAGVKFEIYHNHTTADHPKTVYHVRKLKKWWEDKGINYTVSFPYYKGERTSFWELIPLKGLPLRIQRWCCEVLKEYGGENRYTVTGVRWSESVRRKNTRGTFETFTPNIKNKIILNNDNDFKRKMTEFCMSKGKIVINPIIDWEDEDAWEFINKYDLPKNPLYNEGFKRIGCVGCPMGNNADEIENLPQFKKLFMSAIAKYLENRIAKGKQNTGMWETPEKCYLWWTEQIKKENIDENQITFDDLEE